MLEPGQLASSNASRAECQCADACSISHTMVTLCCCLHTPPPLLLLLQVGQNLKSPRFPVWVVCSESHFSTLALAAPQPPPGLQQQQQHAASSSSSSSAGSYIGLSCSLQPAPGAALVLEYYDGMARQQEPIQLQLLQAPGGVGWSSRLADVAEERGCWQGRPIPPLECVVETKWRDVAVTWQGSEPIL
jgi:hypothetical protein